GQKHYDRKKVMINTIFFVIGISFAFFLLGMGLSVLGRFFSGNQLLFVRIGGIIVILFGLYQLGIFGFSMILGKEMRLPIDIGKLSMSPLTALIMGFVISFAWSPCIGPVLSSVLIMAASAESAAVGFGLIGVYTLGYIIPFLLLGVFTTTLLEFFSKHRKVVKYTVKVGAVLMIFMGIMMFTGKLNSISGYLSQFTGAQVSISESSETVYDSDKSSDANVLGGSAEAADDIVDTQGIEADANGQVSNESQADGSAKADGDGQNVDENQSDSSSEESSAELLPAPEFTLTDQYGVSHSLSDYRGKIVFLNFWATWCPPCRAEMPYIQELYEEYSADSDSDVVILSVAFPNMGSETDIDGIKSFLDENGYTYPVLMDEGATIQLAYYITSFPTTFIIDPDGNVLGYIPGGMTKEIMLDVIDQARNYQNN
uniref:redoxin domain-containing protein n=1 Tax=Butyrivibrio sp. TaxID=28121 RepID=UPI0025D9904D